MANRCRFKCRIVSKSIESIVKFFNVMRSIDMCEGLSMNRIYNLDRIDKNNDDGIIITPSIDNGVFFVDLIGSCAWSVKGCIVFRNDPDIKEQEPMRKTWRDVRGVIRFQNFYVGAEWLCEKLGCAFEIFGEDRPLKLYEHYVIGTNGEHQMCKQLKMAKTSWLRDVVMSDPDKLLSANT